MPKIERPDINIAPFGSEANGLDRTIFGDSNQSDLIKDNLTTDYLVGWGIIGTNDKPPKQYFNAIGYTATALSSYLFQQGIAEYAPLQKYYINSRCVGDDGKVYKSLSGTNESPNIGNNPVENPDLWEVTDTTPTVRTIADLRQMQGTPKEVRVLGYHSENDGVFGSKVFKKIDTGADNNGTIIESANGVYELQFGDEIVNIKWFGAKAGVDSDTVYIQYCIDAGYDVAYFPKGDYIADKTVLERIKIVHNGDATFNNTITSQTNLTATRYYGASHQPNEVTGYFNKISATSNACRIGMGTESQPNRIGYFVYVGEFECDGVKTDFDITLDFVLNSNTGRYDIKLALIRLSDRARFPKVLDTDYTVSGYGTDSITVTMNSAPTAEYALAIKIMSDTPNSATPLLADVNGYDNTVTGEGPMTVMFGAHHADTGNAGGHNTYIGGSYNACLEGTAYSIMGGSDNTFKSTTYGAMFGGRNIVENSYSAFMAGSSNWMSGSSSSTMTGTENKCINTPSSFVFGRRADSFIAGSITGGFGTSLSRTDGENQLTIAGLSKITTDADETFMKQVTGASSIKLSFNTYVAAMYTVVASGNNGGSAMWEAKALIKSADDGTLSFVGVPTVTKLFSENTGDDYNFRLQVASTSLYSRCTGVDGEEVNWTATISMTEAKFIV